MKVIGFQTPCFDTLQYDPGAPTAGVHNNVIILRGQGSKKIDSLIASWAPASGADDPATLRTGRLIIALGSLTDNAFIDPILPLTPASVGLEKIIRDILTTTGTHKVVQLGELGVIIEPGAVVSIIQTPMYVAGDANGKCSPTLATLNVGASQLYNDDENNLRLKLR